MRLVLEIQGLGVQPEIAGGGAALVALMSFALARGFGATHPLIALADRLHGVHGIPMGPLTTFYEADIEDAEDVAKFEMAWQDPGPLAQALTSIATAIRNDPETRSLAEQAGAEALPAQCEEVVGLLGRADANRAKVRLGYHL
jgi:hypothetical protein